MKFQFSFPRSHNAINTDRCDGIRVLFTMVGSSLTLTFASLKVCPSGLPAFVNESREGIVSKVARKWASAQTEPKASWACSGKSLCFC